MTNNVDKTRAELIAECKVRNIRGYSGKKKEELVALLGGALAPAPATAPANDIIVPVRQEIVCGDCLEVMAGLPAESAQIVIADPPYNIGKDFGNDSDKQPLDEYLTWCDRWITEGLRVLKPNGTMFIYGFSEMLALVLARVPLGVNRRWLIWHYTNKNVASLRFWQRSHESILVLWRNEKVFNRDDVREPYTEGFLNGASGRRRAGTQGRFGDAEDTVYTAHPGGALPRDVIKVPALAGGAGAKERVDHPTQKPLALCERLLKSCRQGAGGGLVVVPFAGSGSECVAAKRLGLPFLGIELNPEYCELARGRLSEVETADNPTMKV
jgi:site-specific DNA-methyltransferase (adenine-specific)